MAMSKIDPAAQFSAGHFLNAAMVLKAAETIRRHGLNIGTFIIDEGWQDQRGDWNVNTERFPDMRGVVDKLHAMGFNVLLWWAPFLTSPGAAVHARPELLTVNPRYGQTLLDYTRPETRAYIQAKLDRWFGDGPGGWDFDGVKIDFMAEVVYPSQATTDPEWRGEERLMHHLFHMVDATLARFKDCRGILGEAYNPYLAAHCVTFQFEERFDRTLDYVEARPAMAEALLPGAWLAPHFTYHTDLICPLARRVRRVGGIPQIGKVLAPDITPGLLAELREVLA